MRKRDAALRQLVANSCPERSLSAHARDVARLACRYAASAWRFDREKKEMPKEYAGTPKAYLWQAFKSGARMPLGAVTIATGVIGDVMVATVLTGRSARNRNELVGQENSLLRIRAAATSTFSFS